MLHVQNLNYVSRGTILFQRLSVIMADAILAVGVYRLCNHLKTLKSLQKRRSLGVEENMQDCDWLYPHLLLSGSLFLCGQGRVMSSPHFFQDWALTSALWFSILLNLKHIYLYVAPVYFVYLLRRHCMSEKGFNFTKFLGLGATAISVFAIAFGPFIYMGQGQQVLRRLFPFKRGLCHAYWAPNFWALYNTADKTLSISGGCSRIGRLLGYDVPLEKGVMTGGLVQEYVHSVLPSVPPIATFLLTFSFMIPALWSVWRRPIPQQFLKSLILCAFASFLFGWHVHEKAILLITIPLACLALLEDEAASLYAFLANAALFSLFPLFFTPFENLLKVFIWIADVTATVLIGSSVCLLLMGPHFSGLGYFLSFPPLDANLLLLCDWSDDIMAGILEIEFLSGVERQEENKESVKPVSCIRHLGSMTKSGNAEGEEEEAKAESTESVSKNVTENESATQDEDSEDESLALQTLKLHLAQMTAKRVEHLNQVAFLEDSLAVLQKENQQLRARMEAGLRESSDWRLQVAEELKVLVSKQQLLEEVNARLQEGAESMKKELKELQLDDCQYKVLKMQKEEDLSVKDVVRIHIYEQTRFLRQENLKLYETMGALKRENGELRTRLDWKTKEVEHIRLLYAELEKVHAQVEREYGKFKALFGDAGDPVADYERWKEKRNLLIQDTNHLRDLVSNLRLEVEGKDMEVKALQEEIRILTRSKEGLEKDKGNWEKRTKKAEEDIVLLNKSLTEARENATKSKFLLENSRKEAELEWKHQVEHERRLMEGKYHRQLSSLRQEIHATREEQKHSDARLQALQQDYDDLLAKHECLGQEKLRMECEVRLLGMRLEQADVRCSEDSFALDLLRIENERLSHKFQEMKLEEVKWLDHLMRKELLDEETEVILRNLKTRFKDLQAENAQLKSHELLSGKGKIGAYVEEIKALKKEVAHLSEKVQRHNCGDRNLHHGSKTGVPHNSPRPKTRVVPQ
ncbi:unnamed protein product [Darwinula stevensoni]|uniref:dolichyl-P-Glc:Glc1Man9GlcNAc2-PP-dolichol alpha-1,3-glucosyltransferase n=1 Tax=Darwinula stevensoni TaxID=69355 RepID=A0A7R9A411_9CRUS|nr:unnamed protein product [Darwinula stevensoni]CAG0883305.1 unnamed protein product [Darwinula stevensoni]